MAALDFPAAPRAPCGDSANGQSRDETCAVLVDGGPESARLWPLREGGGTSFRGRHHEDPKVEEGTAWCLDVFEGFGRKGPPEMRNAGCQGGGTVESS